MKRALPMSSLSTVYYDIFFLGFLACVTSLVLSSSSGLNGPLLFSLAPWEFVTLQLLLAA